MTTAELHDRVDAITSSSASRSWWKWLPPVVLLVFGSVLLLRGHSLWFDELYTAEVTRHSLPEIVRAVVDGRGTTTYLEEVPPSYNAPYYLLVKAWVALPFGGGDQSLRVLSLLAAAGGVALLTRAVSRLAGSVTGVVAGLAVAINPLLLKQAVEARSYGLVVLATGAALLGFVRWQDGERRALLLFGLGGAGMGLAHWYALLALAAFVLTGLVLRGRSALPLLAVSAAAMLPTAGLVLVNLLNGNGDGNVAHLVDTDGELPRLAVLAWAGERMSLFWVTLVLAAVALVRVPRLRVLGALWIGVPLIALMLAEAFVRPVFTARYLLPALIALGVLAAAGAVAWPRRLATVLSVVLIATSAVAMRDVLQRDPRERGDEVVALLSVRQQPGEPVVAADRRSALALDHFARLNAPRLATDLIFPPVDPPLGVDRVWLVRREVDGLVSIGDDDAVLEGDGLRVVDEIRFGASATDFVVQLWGR